MRKYFTFITLSVVLFFSVYSYKNMMMPLLFWLINY